MIGYGPEDNYFALELTYNYGTVSYSHGNDFVGIHIYSPDVYKRAVFNTSLAKTQHGDMIAIFDPAGYRFFIHNEKSKSHDPIGQLELASSNLSRSIGKFDIIVKTKGNLSSDYWSKRCGMKLLDSSNRHAVLTFGDDQCQLRLSLADYPIDRGQAFGRVAFACPRNQVRY